MKRLLSFILALVLLMSVPFTASAASPYEKEGVFLKDLGVLKGGTDGDLMLEDNLTREQMVVLISRLYGKESEAEGYLSANSFTDLGPSNLYYIPFILWAKDEGLIKGMTTSTFGVGQPVTTQQFQTVLLRALGYVEEAEDWYNVPEFSKQIGLMRGLNFESEAKLNRGQVAAMLVNALGLNTKGTSSPLAVKLRLVQSPGESEEPEEPEEEPDNDVDDEDVPDYPSLTGSFGFVNNIILTFDKEMDQKIALNKTNYSIFFGNEEISLPTESKISISKDGKSIGITLPQNIGSVFTIIGIEGNVSALKAIGLKDTDGNRTDPSILNVVFDDISAGLGKVIDYDSKYPGKQGALTDEDTIKVRFNVPISSAKVSDFVVPGRDIERIIIDGSNTISLKLDEADETYIRNSTITIVKDNSISTVLNSPVEAADIKIIDLVSPRMISRRADVRREYIEIAFSEPLEEDGSSLYRRDLEVIRLGDRSADDMILRDSDFSTSIKSDDPTILLIEITNSADAAYYSIRIIEVPSYIRDKDGNLVESSDTIETNREL